MRSCRTRIDPGPFMPAKEVEIILGQPMGRSGSVIIPMDWKATSVGALFPVMSADLVLQPLGPGLVEVIFRGSYEPPLGGFGSTPRPGGAASSGRGKRQGLPGSVVPGGRGRQSPQMGRRTRTVVPRPSRLWRVVSPPAFSARLRRLDSPNPDSTEAGSKPFPLIGDRQDEETGSTVGRDLDGGALRVTERIAGGLADDL